MKSKFTSLNPAGFVRPGFVAAAAVACGYWASQILATYYVSEAETGTNPSWTVAAVCFGAFVVLFMLHMLKPWSKTAAIFGLCSLAVFVARMWDESSPLMSYKLERHLPSAITVILISTLFGVAGMALDTNRCWRIFSNPDLSQNSPRQALRCGLARVFRACNRGQGSPNDFVI
ncbi:MAG TPA: hypothetical protein VH280_16475 [Verrucomicrobiae bacterium]|jgi:hypothetical protein|nr:hypothetical protein [Verrucomicrobiae bacterium]